MLEQMMEMDHRAGRPLRAAVVSSSKSGIPDKWFFDKARALGYKFDDEFAFWSDQYAKLFGDKTDHPLDIEESIKNAETKLRRESGEEAFEKMCVDAYGSVDGWREAVREIGRQAYQQGMDKAKLILDEKKARLQ